MIGRQYMVRRGPLLPPDRSSVEIIIKPSSKYEQLDTYDFGSVREDNSFYRNFVKMETQKNTSMLLCLMMHGMFVPSPQNQVIRGEFLLNKFSVAAPGQCSISIQYGLGNRYIQYAICDAVQKGSIVDVPTILREGYAHTTIQNPTSVNYTPNEIFKATPTNLDKMYKNELERISSTVYHSGKVGETNTEGNEFFEKIYTLDNDDPRHGLFLCKDWVEIGGVAMDNLLANRLFIHFMNNRHEPTNNWSADGINSPLKEQFYGKFVQLYNMVSTDKVEDKRLYCIKKFWSSDLFTFCAMYGRSNLSLIDKSCSVFSDCDTIQEYHRLSLHPKSAKGIRKGPRKGSRKNTRKGKKGKVKGSRMVKRSQKYNK